ncbi:MAG: hypothetical protein ABI658_18860 [Acidimicrobiales bacterium]
MKTDANPLHDALSELATTMSSNPDRLRQVRQRVERRRRRRMATGAAVSAGAVAAAVGIAMVPREPASTLQFNAAGSSLPECASIAPPAVDKPKEAVPPKEFDGVVRYKGMAVVAAVGTGSLTLGNFSEAGLLPPADSVVMVIDSATTFEDKGLAAAASDAQVGQTVVFVASIGPDGGIRLDHIELGVDVAPPADPAKDSAAIEAKKSGIAPAASPAEAPSDGLLRGKDVLTAAPVDNMVVVLAPVDGGEPAPIRLVLGADTRYHRLDTACLNPALVAGTVLMYAAVPNADGSYTATEIRIYN